MLEVFDTLCTQSSYLYIFIQIPDTNVCWCSRFGCPASKLIKLARNDRVLNGRWCLILRGDQLDRFRVFMGGISPVNG